MPKSPSEGPFRISPMPISDPADPAPTKESADPAPAAATVRLAIMEGAAIREFEGDAAIAEIPKALRRRAARMNCERTQRGEGRETQQEPQQDSRNSGQVPPQLQFLLNVTSIVRLAREKPTK